MKKELIIIITSAAFFMSFIVAAQEKNDEEKNPRKEIVRDFVKDAKNDTVENAAGPRDIRKKIDDVLRNIKEKSGIAFGGNLAILISDNITNRNIFALDYSELWASHTYKFFQTALLLGFTETRASLDVAFLDFHPIGGTIAPRGRLFEQRGVHFQLGKFDIPFGSDWQFVSATERTTVTRPLTTDLIINGGYNELGFRMLANIMWINFSAYFVRGVYNWKVSGGNSVGGRIAITPVNNPYSFRKRVVSILDIGFSYIHTLDDSFKTHEYAFAFNFEIKIGPVFTNTEFYAKDDYIPHVVLDGFQVTGGLDIGALADFPLSIYTRYDYFRARHNNIEKAYESSGTWTDRIAGGLNLNIQEIFILKIEYIRFLTNFNAVRYAGDYNNQSFYIQVVTSI